MIYLLRIRTRSGERQRIMKNLVYKSLRSAESAALQLNKAAGYPRYEIIKVKEESYENREV